MPLSKISRKIFGWMLDKMLSLSWPFISVESSQLTPLGTFFIKSHFARLKMKFQLFVLEVLEAMTRSLGSEKPLFRRGNLFLILAQAERNHLFTTTALYEGRFSAAELSRASLLLLQFFTGRTLACPITSAKKNYPFAYLFSVHYYKIVFSKK